MLFEKAHTQTQGAGTRLPKAENLQQALKTVDIDLDVVYLTEGMDIQAVINKMHKCIGLVALCESRVLRADARTCVSARGAMVVWPFP